jgi:hypothetical protein
VAAGRGGSGIATWRLVVLAIVSVALLWFVAANFVEVEVRLLVVRADVRLAWALLGAAALGFALWYGIARLRARR